MALPYFVPSIESTPCLPSAILHKRRRLASIDILKDCHSRDIDALSERMSLNRHNRGRWVDQEALSGDIPPIARELTIDTGNDAEKT